MQPAFEQCTHVLCVLFFVYYESIKRELKIRRTYDCRCDERLKIKAEESKRLAYTGLLGGLKHLKIETRLIDEKFANVVGTGVSLIEFIIRGKARAKENTYKWVSV